MGEADRPAHRLADGAAADGLWTNIRLAVPAASGDEAMIAVADGRIAWTGPASTLPAAFMGLPRIDGGGRRVTPGLVDCHTHLVWAGLRADEFAARLRGATYEEIARAGGGIVSTVRATRAASEEQLFEASARRLRALLAEGVCAIEIKSGYGLDLETERRQLRVARELGRAFDVAVYTTYLGAHALPPEYAGRPDAYIDHVTGTVLPALAAEGLVDAVDAFCERIAFSVAQVERVFAAAQALGLPVKLHAEQLSNMGGSALAARHRALSVDHLEYLDEPGVRAIAQSGTVAVLLPGAYYFLRDTQPPPVAALRAQQVPIAIASDCNPGSSPSLSLLMTMNLACTAFRLTVDEVLAGVTRHAAAALGAADRHGVIAAGRSADFVLWDIDSPAELAYWIGGNPAAVVVRRGRVRHAGGRALNVGGF